MSKHYDVVVLGASVGALAAAALLARRSWRVLVLGHGFRPPTYTFEGKTLARRPFTLLSHASPAFGRILVELAQSQTFRRRVSALDPMLQILGDKVRLDLPPDTAQFGREVDREFPEVRRVVDDLYTELARTNAAADAAFDKDVVWPPGGFWERRETTRVAATLPHLREPIDLFAEFPRDHSFRAVLEVPARFASDADDAPPFALARVHGAWTRGVVALGGGEDELIDFFLERVRAHGGEARMGDRAAAIVQKGGRVTGVRIDGDDAPVGVQFVAGDLPTADLLQLAEGFSVSRRAMQQIPRLVPVAHRYVVSAVVRARGLPAMLAREAFLMPGPKLAASGPIVHLQTVRFDARDEAHLVAEALLDDDAPPLEAAREAVLETVERFLPFIERHYLVVDSPHDGRPLWDYRSGTKKEVDRALLRAGGGSLDGEPMIPKWRIEPPTGDIDQLYGVAAEPLRTPLTNAFVVGRSTLPALGQEGELLAAWSVSRIITRTDRRKEKMRRDMWSKVELG
jgi:2-polyprenyl-6-methoxyphenol hydroxylase-like FAD-dependent oxidoreductase